MIVDLVKVLLQCKPNGNKIVWKCQYFRAFWLYYLSFVQSSLLNTFLLKPIFRKLLRAYLMHVWKATLMKIEEFENFKIWGNLW